MVNDRLKLYGVHTHTEVCFSVNTDSLEDEVFISRNIWITKYSAAYSEILPRFNSFLTKCAKFQITQYFIYLQSNFF